VGVIWTSKTRTRQPRGAVRVNWGNPSSRALAVAVSGANPGINLVNGRDAVAYNAVQRTATQVGTGLTWPSTSNTGVQIGPGSLLPGSAGNYTSGMTLILLANPSASTTRTLPFSLSSGAQPTVYVGFNANKALTATSGMLMVQTHGNNGAQAASVIDGEWHVFAVVFPEGSVLPLLYVDGVDVTASSSGSASTYANAAANVYVGGFSSSGFSATGYSIALALGFNRGIPAEEMAELSRNVWQLFAPQRTPVFFSLPAAGASSYGLTYRRRLRVQQPQTQVGVNWANPLTQRITTLVPFGPAGMLDLVSGSRVALASGTLAGDQRGISLRGSGSAACASIPLNLSAYTKIVLSFWMYWNAFANDDDLAMEFTANGASTSGGFGLDPNESATSRFQIFGNGGGNAGAKSFTRPSAAAWHHYMVGLDMSVSGFVSSVYVDGVSQSLVVDVTGNTTVSLANSTLYLFSRNNANLFAAGRMQNLVIRGGADLLESEVQEEYRNPWHLFEPERRPIFFGVGSGANTYAVGISETATASETVSMLAAFGASISETATASETVATTAVLNASISETATASETVAAAASFVVTIGETATASETVAMALGAATFAVDISETATASETVSMLATFGTSISETATASDLVSMLALFQVGISETATASETVAMQLANQTYAGRSARRPRPATPW